MALNEQSSVVFSIQNLLDVENQRILAEETEQQAARAREQQRRDLERERQRIEQEAAIENSRRQQLAELREIEELKLQLQQQSHGELMELRTKLEREYRAKTEATTLQVAELVGRQRILGALLATLLAGTALCWLLLIAPGQQRASNSYASLNALYAGALKEQRRLEDSFRLERQQLKQQLDAMRNQHHPTATAPISEPKTNTQHSKPVSAVTTSKPPCVCIDGDPLCNCLVH